MKAEPYFLPVYENFSETNSFAVMHLKLLIQDLKTLTQFDSAIE